MAVDTETYSPWLDTTNDSMLCESACSCIHGDRRQQDVRITPGLILNEATGQTQQQHLSCPWRV